MLRRSNCITRLHFPCWHLLLLEILELPVLLAHSTLVLIVQTAMDIFLLISILLIIVDLLFDGDVNFSCVHLGNFIRGIGFDEIK